MCVVGGLEGRVRRIASAARCCAGSASLIRPLPKPKRQGGAAVCHDSVGCAVRACSRVVACGQVWPRFKMLLLRKCLWHTTVPCWCLWQSKAAAAFHVHASSVRMDICSLKAFCCKQECAAALDHLQMQQIAQLSPGWAPSSAHKCWGPVGAACCQFTCTCWLNFSCWVLLLYQS